MANLFSLATHLGRRASRRKASIGLALFVTLVAIPLTLYILLAYILAGDPRLVPHAIRNARNVLLIVAHPDDECLFFGPSILNRLGKPHVTRSILVLSSGMATRSTNQSFFFFILPFPLFQSPLVSNIISAVSHHNPSVQRLVAKADVRFQAIMRG
jgi:hypothetical protein